MKQRATTLLFLTAFAIWISVVGCTAEQFKKTVDTTEQAVVATTQAAGDFADDPASDYIPGAKAATVAIVVVGGAILLVLRRLRSKTN